MIETHNSKETSALGKKIGAILKQGEILALTGPLGAGKTTFIQGIAAGLGVKDYVNSPTFTLINEYPGRIPVYHIDLYRLNDISQIEDLGIEEYFGKDGVCLIEWAEKLEQLLPAGSIKITIEVVSENKRKIWLPSEFQARLK